MMLYDVCLMSDVCRVYRA